MSKRRKPTRSRMWAASQQNILMFNYYYDMLKMLATSTFEWKGMPPEIDLRYLEETLFEKGMVVFYKDDVAQFYCALSCTIGGPLNIYRVPLERVAYAPNDYNYRLSANDSVLIYNNMMRMPSIEPITLFANKLAEIDRTIQVNVNAQKTPVLLRTSQEQQLVLKNLYNQYEGNEPFIIGDKSLQMTPLEVLQTGAPYVAGNLQFLKYQIYHEALEYLGIESDATSKKERLVSDEMQMSMGGVIANRYNRLSVRQMACEQINRMFGLNVSVTFKSEFKHGVTGESTGSFVPMEDRTDE